MRFLLLLLLAGCSQLATLPKPQPSPVLTLKEKHPWVLPSPVPLRIYQHFPIHFKVITPPYKPDDVQYLRAAADTWNTAVGEKVFSFEEPCGWVREVEVTYYYIKEYQGANIVLGRATLGRIEAIDPDGPQWVLRLYDDMASQYHYKVPLHELGHLLGMDHNTVPGSVMGPTANTHGEDLIPRDIEEAKANIKRIHEYLGIPKEFTCVPR